MSVVLGLLLVSCSEHSAKKQVENCADKKHNDWFFKTAVGNMEGLDRRLTMWERDRLKNIGMIERIIMDYEWFNRMGLAVFIDHDENFIHQSLDKKMKLSRYEDYFIKCEKERNFAKISFKEKWKNKPKLKFPPKKFKWYSLDIIIKESGWGTSKYKTGDLQKYIKKTYQN